MVGIFDSGVGGLTSLDRLRQLLPSADMCYLADSDNAPYGIKTEKELVMLVRRDIERLLAARCKKILIACCTASAVYNRLPSAYRAVSFPIIEPAARRAAELTKFGKIAVICTEFTKRSLAFDKALLALGCEPTVISSGALVTLAELGVRDGAVDKEARLVIERELSPLWGTECDTLILGCTHFTHLSKEIEDILKIKTVSASLVGAEEFARHLKDFGEGKTLFI